MPDAPAPPPAPEVAQLHEILLHGHRVFYRAAGIGPVVVLVHGITSTSATWAHVLYRFPEHCERLVLISSGGLGREITPLLRAASLPGAERVLPLLVNDRLLNIGRTGGRMLGRFGLRVHTDLGEVLRGHASLSDGETRPAFLHTLRTILDPSGQRVSAADRLCLAQAIPFLLIWGGRDAIIPVEHARAAHALVPGSCLEVFPQAGHFPHLDDPLRFVRVLIDLIETSEPAQVDAERWGELLRSGGQAA